MNNMTRKALLLAFLVVFAAYGCDAGPAHNVTEVLPGAGDFVDHATLPIFNGAPPDAPEHAATVSLHQLVSRGTRVYVQPFCSGTLVDYDVVVTAAHCLDTAKGGSKFKTLAPSSLAIYVGDNPSVDILSHLYRVRQTLINPSYNRISLRNDIALVRLSTGIAEAIDPVSNLPTSLGLTTADVGSWANFAGFGKTETGSAGVKLQVDLPIGSLGCTITGCPSGVSTATQFSYAQQAGGPCFGDSGGPAFMYRSGVPYLAGVTSFGDSRCTVYGVSTRVDAYANWINTFIAQ
ncbi:MAG: hypothetical protein C4523_04420 [Myxococcales bacterium]|nr:MAG: hypothetical protein C4523_04420 [Myxococcales bacterium]